VLSPIVVECREGAKNFGEVWKHQLRWARTIRVCQPAPYFFSVLSNAGLWAMVCLVISISRVHFGHMEWHVEQNVTYGVAHNSFPLTFVVGAFFILSRIIIAQNLQSRLTRTSDDFAYFWLVPLKDLLQGAIWLCAFIGNRIEWRGQEYRLRRDGTLEKRV